MNLSDNSAAKHEPTLKVADDVDVLAREAGVPFHLPMSKVSGTDPFTEWLSLMEVVQMLCPTWPVRDKPIQGTHWNL